MNKLVGVRWGDLKEETKEFLLLNSNPDKAIPLIVISSVMAGVTPTTKIINHNGYALIWSKTKATSFV